MNTSLASLLSSGALAEALQEIFEDEPQRPGPYAWRLTPVRGPDQLIESVILEPIEVPA